MNLESIGSLKDAQIACGAQHTVTKIVRALNGQVVRIEGTITIDNEEVQASWVKTGRLITLRGMSVSTLAQEADYSLCLIEKIQKP